VVLDRALRAGYVDPFTTPDVRAQMLDALRGLAAEGAIARPETGVYERNPEG